ncbi:putative actin cytoskeleton organization and vesicular protein [Xylaria bambusicola]|uniref:putative actin cytoskeleton organization and vesicular protein n=1 Tax=Xylaria bambusicola TaxID=326684 RepID=UPI0020082F48|nr:putative actin cytoskeleton organization and vesicular protein [Xylaria bambusicola]KAI0520824.1 putative actin cytoskeleton organization and vesicular protein [Xylaria bambusicola]
MAKKRAREADGATEAPDKMVEDSDSSDDEDFDMVNVDFEWFNFNEKVDFHGMKNLIRQLFDVDATLFDVSALVDLILSQSTIGSTVKTDGEESDPFAFVTALNIQEHRQKQPIAQLIEYLSEKAKATESLAPIPELLASGKHVGLVLSERVINMPSDVAPPLYSMLMEEIQDAVDDKEPYEFTHYLIVSKTYHEIESTLAEERKKKKGRQDATLFYFHEEDEVLQKHAIAYGSYPFTKMDDTVADSKRAFQEMGVMPMGSMILIEASKFAGAVKAVGEYLNPPS